MEGLEDLHARLRACGVDDPRAWDVWTAMLAGLAAQQNANDPGGDRWLRLADETTDMFLEHYARGTRREGKDRS